MSVSFTARPVSVYKPFQENVKSLTVYELETRDLDFLSKFHKKMKNDVFLKQEMPVHSSMISFTLDSIVRALKIKDTFQLNDKSVAYAAVSEGKITALIQGNVPKINLKNDKIVYSTRNKKNETELEWLTVVPRKNKEIPRYSAPAVVAELFNYFKHLKSKPKSVYVRSEVPETCNKSVEFYQKMGFKKVSDKNILWGTPKDPLPIANFLMAENFTYGSDLAIPMAITIDNAMRTFSSVSTRFQRYPLFNAPSVDLSSIVK